MDDEDDHIPVDDNDDLVPPSSPSMSMSPDMSDTGSVDTRFSYQTQSAAMSISDDTSLLSAAPSTYSLTDSLLQQSYRVEHGRFINNYSDVYGLPADEEEAYRLNVQHQLFTRMYGAFPQILHDILAPDASGQKAVVDFGCGSGAWIFDVARSFPLSRAVGVDLTPLTGPSPPNFTNEVDDLNLGLQHHYSQFDVVHTRFVAQGIQDYQSYIDHMAKCLRPKGLLILCEFDFKVYRLDKVPYPPWGPSYTPNGQYINTPFLCHWFNALNGAIESRGGSFATEFMYDWVKNHPFFDAADIAYQEMYFPFGPYTLTQDLVNIGYDASKLNSVGEMVRKDVHSFLRGGRVMLLSNLSEGEVDLLENPAHIELDDMRYPGLARVVTVYARRKTNVENVLARQNQDEHEM